MSATVDGIEFYLDATKFSTPLAEIKKQTAEFDQTVKVVKEDLISMGAATAQNVPAFADFAQKVGMSEEMLSQLNAALTQQRSSVAMNSTEYKQLTNAITILNAASSQAIAAQRGAAVVQGDSTRAVSSATMAMGQLGYATNDAAMFFVNFRMGILGVANNIPMIVQSLMQARTAAAGAGTTFRSVLATSLMGSGGVLLAINVVMTALMAFSTSKAQKETKDLANEAADAARKLRDMKDALDVLSFKTTQQAKDTLKDFNKSQKDKVDKLLQEKKLNEKNFEFNKRMAQYYYDKSKEGTQLMGSGDLLQKATEYSNWANYNMQRGPQIDKEIKDTFIQMGGQGTYSEQIANVDKLTKSYSSHILTLKDAQAQTKKMRQGEFDMLMGNLQDQQKAYAKGSTQYALLETNMKNLKKAWDPGKDNGGPNRNRDNSLANIKKEIEDLSGKQKEYNIQLNKTTTEFEKQKQILANRRESEIGGLDAYISALSGKKGKTDKKGISLFTAVDQEQINKANTEKLIAESKYNVDLDKLTKEHNDKLLKDEYDFNKAILEIRGASKSELLQLERNYLLKQKSINTDPDVGTNIDAQLKLNEEKKKQLAIAGEKDVSDVVDNFRISTLETDKQSYAKQLLELKNKYLKEIELHKGNLALILLLFAKYANDKAILDKEQGQKEKERTSNSIQQVVDNWKSAFSDLFSMQQQNVKDDLDVYKTKEQKKLDSDKKYALAHARTTKEKEKIEEDYQNKKDKLDEEVSKKARERLIVWFRMKQLGDIASAYMSTYTAAAAALDPHYAGPIAGWVVAAAVIASGLANVAMIASQRLPGYERGGIVVGEKGPEIIAPMQDYASGQSLLINQVIREINRGGGGGNNNEIVRRLDKLESAITNRPIQLSLNVDKKLAKKIYALGNGEIRTSRI